MLSERTWPNPLNGSLKINSLIILQKYGMNIDCMLGETKVFIKNSKTLFKLEELRKKRLDEIVVLIQKVSFINNTTVF